MCIHVEEQQDKTFRFRGTYRDTWYLENIWRALVYKLFVYANFQVKVCRFCSVLKYLPMNLAPRAPKDIAFGSLKHIRKAKHPQLS